MNIGVALSASTAANYVDEMVSLAGEAAGFGLRSAWFAQRLDYDAASLAALVGRAVPGIDVGTSAIPIFGRHPLLVSSQAQTAQAATHGRFHLGLALSAQSFVESTFGLPYHRPIAQLREFLTVIGSLLEGRPAQFRGEFVTAVTGPATVPGAQPRVPLLVAAMGPQALRVTGELADGTLPYLAGPRALGEHIVPEITAAAQRAGRPAPRIAAIVPTLVTDDVEGMRAKAIQWLSFADGMPSYQRVIAQSGARKAGEIMVLGDERAVAASLQSYFDAGATEVIITQTNIDGDQARRRTWEAAGALNRAPAAENPSGPATAAAPPG